MEKSEEYVTNRHLWEKFGDIQKAEHALEILSCEDPEVTQTQTVFLMFKMCYYALKAILKVLISIEGKL